MKCGLFEALTGRFADGERLSDVAEGDRRLRSILGNLGRLFNTRQGSLLHIPEYGLPDITDLSRTSPADLERLRRAIRESVERFEPRLRRVRVDQEASDPSSPYLVFLLSAEVTPGGRVQFQTTFRGDELVDVRQRKGGE